MRKAFALAGIAAVLAFTVGLYSGYVQNAPLRLALEVRKFFIPPLPEIGMQDEYRRQIKTTVAAVPCPPDARVMIVAGQSNAANFVGRRYKGEPHVFQFFRGECYPAIDPLLGAEGRAGSLWVLMANELPGNIVLVPMAIGGTTIQHWNTKLVPVIDETLGALKGRYVPSDFLWQQGESNSERTTTEAYRDGLNALVGRVKATYPDVRVYVARSTYCDGRGPDEKVRAAQSAFPGPDTDVFRAFDDRRDDCHFSGVAQPKVASEWARVTHRD